MAEVTLESNENSSLANAGAAVETIDNTLSKFLSAASVEAVYGTPVKHGDKLIIPSAEVLSAMGFGVGMGVGEDESNSGGGGGGGGGGRVLSRPVAVIISEPEGVRVEPVFDATKIALALFTALGFMAGMSMRMRRGGNTE